MEDQFPATFDMDAGAKKTKPAAASFPRLAPPPKSASPLASLAALIPRQSDAEYIAALEERLLAAPAPGRMEDEEESVLEATLLEDGDQGGSHHDFGSDFEDEVLLTPEDKRRSGLGMFGRVPLDLISLVIGPMRPPAFFSLMAAFPVAVAVHVASRNRHYWLALYFLTLDYASEYLRQRQSADLPTRLQRVFYFQDRDSELFEDDVPGILAQDELGQNLDMRQVVEQYRHTLSFTFPELGATAEEGD